MVALFFASCMTSLGFKCALSQLSLDFLLKSAKCIPGEITVRLGCLVI